MPRHCSLEPLKKNLWLPPWNRWQRQPSGFTIAAHGSKTCRRNKFWPNVFVNGNPEEISDSAHLTRQIGLQVIEVDEQNIRAASHHRRPGPGRGDLRLDVAMIKERFRRVRGTQGSAATSRRPGGLAANSGAEGEAPASYKFTDPAPKIGAILDCLQDFCCDAERRVELICRDRPISCISASWRDGQVAGGTWSKRLCRTIIATATI